MNSFKYIFSLAILVAVLGSCQKENFGDTSFLESSESPAQISALFDITQDNTGLVTITPNGEGASSFDVFFGHGTTTPAKVEAGKSVQRIYPEGVYNVKIIGYGLTGKVTEKVIPLTVSFKAPEDLKVVVAPDPANNFKINVSATAKYETVFKVYYGDVDNEVPKSFLEGETISHTYAKVGSYILKVVALSGGAATTTYTDTINIVNPILLPVDFESPTLDYAFINFDGGNSTVLDNPHKTADNPSNKVSKMVKGAGQPWGGSVLKLGGNIDFSSNKIFRMKVYSPRVGAKVLLKVENSSDSNKAFEKEVTTTVANEWVDLVFDYSAINTSNTYQNLVLIFDLGTVGNGSSDFTFYFDDIRLTKNLPATLSQIKLPVSFDDETVNNTVTDFGNNSTVNGTDPVNVTNKVKVTTKPNGAETWAGTTIGTSDGFATKIPISSSATKMSVRVYSPAAGIPVRLKIEDSNDANKSVETQVSTTKANEWETLVFDFTNHATGTAALNLAYNFNKASIFFDFGNTGSGKVFYWDDVQMVASDNGVLGLPLDFQSLTLNYDFINFDGGNLTVADNPAAGGINGSSKVAKMVKGAGQPWGGALLKLPNPIDFSVNKTFTVKVYSPRVGAKMLLKVENKSDAAVNFEKEVVTTKANAWETLTFDYSAISTVALYHNLVFIFDNGTPGDGTANYTFYFDDITLN
ncbi:hypothetical protein [Daejeonella sp.]|uniref:hypothetical protein n=1 Tax=Daejeonella sp. TaxID=2805397 RepID=UPI0025C513DE|nr:hypothetical protein [Daejeonella sp.]